MLQSPHTTFISILLTFAKKELRFIINDTKTLFFIFAIPTIELLLAGFAFINDVKDVEVAILDLDQSQITHHITEDINASPFFYVQKTLHSPSEITKVFKTGEARLIIVFNRGFDRNLLRNGKMDMQLIPDMSDPNTGLVFTNYAKNIINERMQKDYSTQANIHSSMIYNPTLENSFYFIPGTTGMVFTLICGLMTSFSITREKERGTLSMLKLSPINSTVILMGKIFPYFILSLINMFIIFLISIFVFHIPVPTHIITMLAFSSLFILVLLLTGLLISFFAENQVEATLLSGIFMVVPITMLSGMIFPIENMPHALQYLSDIIPARWFTMGFKTIVIKGLGFSYITTETLALIAIGTALCITVGLLNKKNKM